MERRTYSELLTEVKDELSLDEDTVIKDAEFVRYCNDSIHNAESIINMLRKDYFLKDAQLKNQAGSNGLVSGQADYPFPADMHALKIREICYINGSIINEITPFRRGNKFIEVAQVNYNNTIQNGRYSYMTLNPSVYDPSNPYTTGPMIRMIPTPLETGDYVTLWYLRSAQKVPLTENSNTQIDIPEFYDYVKAAFLLKCAMKEGVPNIVEHADTFKIVKAEMIKNLRNKTDDDNDTIPQDISAYSDFVGGIPSGMELTRGR